MTLVPPPSSPPARPARSASIDYTSRRVARTAPSPDRAVTVRSVLAGLLGVLLVCGLTPYNDFALANTFAVGNFLPVGLLLYVLVLVLVVNAPLRRFAPRLALGGGELAVALGMTLVSCTLPASGLMRYLPAGMVGMQYQAGTTGDYRDVLEQVDLPAWVLPTFAADTIVGRANDPVVSYYRGRTPGVGDSWADAVRAVPWSAWVRPALTWGVLLVGVYGAVGCAAVIVRRQWVENERLAFPLAGVYLSVIEPPAPGRAVNALFSSRGFWVAAGSVFAVHGMNGLHQYLPDVPLVPLGYDLRGVFSEGPLRFTDWTFKQSTLYFSVIGVTFFLQSKVAFSLWAFYGLYQVAQVMLRSLGSEMTGGVKADGQFGGLLVYAAVAVWIGRAHWGLVVRQMARGSRPGEPAGRYLPYPAAGWGFVGCSVLIAGWLVAAGSSVVGAAVLTGMLGLTMLAMARVVAETGLVFAQFIVPLNRPYAYALSLPTPLRAGDGDVFYAGWFQQLFGDLRETSSVYATHALRVADDAAYRDVPDAPGAWRRAGPFLACLALAMVVGYAASGAATLFVEYNHATPLGVGADGILNPYGVDDSVKSQMLDPARDLLPPRTGPVESHSRFGHLALGGAIVAATSALRLRFEAWPLHPVGFLMAYSYPMGRIWSSILVGWVLKVVVVRFGGASLLRSARPLFLGLVIGEAGAAAFWLLVSLGLNAAGLPFRTVNLLPT